MGIVEKKSRRPCTFSIRQIRGAQTDNDAVPTSLRDGIDIRDGQAMATSQEVDEFSFSDPDNETGSINSSYKNLT